MRMEIFGKTTITSGLHGGVYNNNGYCVHISVEAGNGNDYSQAQIDAREWLTRKIMGDLNVPASKVKGHWEVYNNSACPGYSKEQMDAFRARLGNLQLQHQSRLRRCAYRQLR